MQKSAIHVITGSSYNAHTELQFVQRINHNFLPSSTFNDTWVKNSIRNIGEKRHSAMKFQPTSSNTCKLINLFPLHNFPKIRQKFPDEQIKIIRKPSEFDAKVNNYFLADLAPIVVCNRLFCPAGLQAAWDKLNYKIVIFSSPIHSVTRSLSVCLVWSFAILFNNLSSVYWWNSRASLP